jgi:hypothetical protein
MQGHGKYKVPHKYLVIYTPNKQKGKIPSPIILYKMV